MSVKRFLIIEDSFGDAQEFDTADPTCHPSSACGGCWQCLVEQARFAGLTVREERRFTAPSEQEFRRHLTEASAEVRTWPAWKQKILGGEAVSGECKVCGGRCGNTHGDACTWSGPGGSTTVAKRSNHQMKTFYLSGPMRGYEKFNFPAFDAAAAAGRKLGFRVISPADLDRANGIDENSVVEEASGFPAQRTFARRDCDVLLGLRCENGDGIALLPGWEKSTGGLAELMLARWLGLTVLDARTWKPFTKSALVELDLTAVVQNLRKFLGDSNATLYLEDVRDGVGLLEA